MAEAPEFTHTSFPFFNNEHGSCFFDPLVLVYYVLSLKNREIWSRLKAASIGNEFFKWMSTLIESVRPDILACLSCVSSRSRSSAIATMFQQCTQKLASPRNQAIRAFALRNPDCASGSQHYGSPDAVIEVMAGTPSESFHIKASATLPCTTCGASFLFSAYLPAFSVGSFHLQVDLCSPIFCSFFIFTFVTSARGGRQC
jgi:hypothetical protein